MSLNKVTVLHLVLTSASLLRRYVEFDFHHECRGMRYENISKLITALESDLEEMQ